MVDYCGFHVGEYTYSSHGSVMGFCILLELLRESSQEWSEMGPYKWPKING